MAFSALTTAEVQAGQPVKQSLQTKIKDNFDDHESRITANAVSLENKYGGSLFNVGAAYSAAAGALTITLKQQDGSTDPTAGSPARVAVRSATATSATYSIIDVESAINITIPSGATLGGTNAVATRYYLYLLSNAGTGELAVSGKGYNDSVVTTVGISAASDTSETVYSSSARSNVPITPIGYFDVTTVSSGVWVTPTTVLTGKPETIGNMGDFTGETIENSQSLDDCLDDLNAVSTENTIGYSTIGAVSGSVSSWTTIDTFDIFSPTGKIAATYHMGFPGGGGAVVSDYRVQVGGTTIIAHSESTGATSFKDLAFVDKGSKGTYTVNVQVRGLVPAAYTWNLSYSRLIVFGK